MTKPIYKQIITYIIALLLAGGSAFLANDVMTFGGLMVLGVMMFVMTAYIVFAKEAKKVADGIFAVLFFMVGFWVFWFGGTLFGSNCFIDDAGIQRCVMPTAHMLVGFVIAFIATPLSWRFYKAKRTQRNEMIWLLAIMVGWAMGLLINVLGGVVVYYLVILIYVIVCG
ncbi:MULTISPECIES: hypothetical protein [Moraxella]|uniref:Uncharacterized protein n=1 Tax=Moraxella lacunata TaxID=477 RepID=A0A1B8Q5Q6_MORLA|nr:MULTISPECIES: hypothetical protein [Moraxella]MBE9577676.1 hypothetical protein [Moraxella sp. K1664]MBE9587066.1 hypothetical protein [Moraxella sp. K1630]MBE9590474.1 hypothetical protein [Moraxella sp. K127]MBE9595304.1 hypothetical protein [Moraxella sp. K2450]MDH9217723.1 hypothetical protein [Moraxella lacunata]